MQPFHCRETVVIFGLLRDLLRAQAALSCGSTPSLSATHGANTGFYSQESLLLSTQTLELCSEQGGVAAVDLWSQ